MEFQFEKVKADSLMVLGNAQSVVESILSEATSEGISQVLSLSADARVLSAEALRGEAVVTGRVNFKLLYLSEGEPRSLDMFADFTERVSGEDIQSGMKLISSMQVVDAEVESGAGFRLRAVVETTIGALMKKEKSCLRSSDCAHVECRAARVTEHIGTAVTETELEDEVDTGGTVERVLLLDAQAMVSGTKTGEEVVLVTGDAEAKVLYVLDGVTKSVSFTIPFDEEVAVAGVSLTDLATAKATVVSSRVVLAGEEGNNILRVELRIALRVDAFMVKEQQLAFDAFSLEKELTVETDSLVAECLLGSAHFTDLLSGIATLADGAAAAREIMGVFSGRNQIASVFSGEQTLTVEGLVTATVLYTDENGISSVQVELPYSFTGACEAVGEGSKPRIEAQVYELSAQIKRDKEIEVRAKLVLNADIFEDINLEFVNNVIEGGDKPQNNSTVSVYVADEGDSIWEAVKALTATPADIMAQNPTLEFPLKAGVKIVYFRAMSC